MISSDIQKLPYIIDNDFKSSLPFFHKPDLNQASLNPKSLIDFHIQNNSNYPFGILADSLGKKDIITWNEFGSAIISLAQRLYQSIQPDAENPPIVAIITSSEPLTYFTVLLALMRAGCVPFAISPRNSPAAIAHLLKSTACHHVYVQYNPQHTSSDHIPEQLAQQQINEALPLLPESHLLQLHQMPTASDLFPRLVHHSPYHDNPNLVDQSKSIPFTNPAAHLPVMIVHSSGTTAFPKPIHLDRFGIQGWLLASQYGPFCWQAEVTASMVLPAFHAMGIYFGFFNNLTEGSISGFFRPEFDQNARWVPKIPNPENVIQVIRDIGCTIASFSPVMLSQYASEPSSVKVLQNLKRVAFGGGPLSAAVGNQLVESGIELCTMYGSSEVGPTSTHFPSHAFGRDWEYFDLSPQLTTRLIPREDGVYELVILSSDRHRCSVTYVTQDSSPQTYHTNDLLIKHPTRPSLYRIVGRLDDQIMLSNSEKTNPGPLEAIIQFHPAIRGALMFGRGKPQNGVMIEPEEAYAVDVNDRVAVERYIDLIWPSIEEANRFAPTHSRLTRDLILIVDPRTTEIPKTSKGQVSRVKTLELLSSQIEAIYQSPQSAIILPFLGLESIPRCIECIVSHVLEREVNVADDLFMQGCDSLAANRIRTQILHLIKLASPSSVSQPPNVPQNLVYQNPTIPALSQWVTNQSMISISPLPISSSHRLDPCVALRKMILKYSPSATNRLNHPILI